MTKIFEDELYKYVDYKKVYKCADEYLCISTSISDFPFKVKNFVYEMSDIKLCSYRKSEEKFGVSPRIFGSESALILELFGVHIIFFNQNEPDYRVRFSVIHEFAHYVLGHKMDLKQTDERYHIQELEANCFTAQILMPEQLLRECKKRHKALTLDYITDSFGVSKDAAQKRIRTLAKSNHEWKNRAEYDYDDIIINKFTQKLDEIAPMPREHEFFDYEEEYNKQQERNSWLY